MVDRATKSLDSVWECEEAESQSSKFVCVGRLWAIIVGVWAICDIPYGFIPLVKHFPCNYVLL